MALLKNGVFGAAKLWGDALRFLSGFGLHGAPKAIAAVGPIRHIPIGSREERRFEEWT
jgi:hypothetical protein